MANDGLITVQDFQDRFKASGVYTIYRDQTVTANAQSSSVLRLLPGFSKKGIINVPVYIEKNDKSAAYQLFGDIDTSLEANGSFFHRSLDIMLNEGPVLALNLLKVNNEIDDQTGLPTSNADTVSYKSFSTDIAGENGSVTNKLFASFFDKQRFWKPNKNYLLATRNVLDNGKIFNLVNLSQTPYSFIIRKSTVRGYDITVREWYGNSNVPKYLKPSDFISDYFIDIIVVAGNYGPDRYQQLSIDPVMGNYFDGNGIKTDQLNSFLGRSEISVIDIFTGCLIPNFKDKNGVSQYIESTVNAKTNTTGILCAIDKKELDKFETGQNTNFLDLVGHRLIGNDITDVNFLSYKKKLTNDFTYSRVTANTTYGINSSSGILITPSVGKITVSITTVSPQFNLLRDTLELGNLFKGTTTAQGLAQGITINNPVLTVTRLTKTSGQIVFELTNSLKDNETATSGSFVDLNVTTNTTGVAGTAVVAITEIGTVGDVVTLKVNNGVSLVSVGNLTITGTHTVSTANTALASSINAGTGTHGYSATFASGVITVSAPVSAGYDSTNFLIEFDSTGSTVTQINSTFVGGIHAVNNGLSFESTNNRFVIDSSGSYYVADKGSDIYKDWLQDKINDGAKLTNGSNTYYIKFTTERAQGGVDVANDFREILVARLYVDSEMEILAPVTSAIAFGSSIDSGGYTVTGTKLNFISIDGAIKDRFETTFVSPKIVRLPISEEPNIKTGDFLTAIDENGEEILTRIVSIKRIGSPVPIEIELQTQNVIKTFSSTSGDSLIERWKPVTTYFDHLDFTYLQGFVLRDTHMPDGTNKRMKEILSVMLEGNMFDALVDPEMSRFRYYVDTFNHGLEHGSKMAISKMIQTRQKCLGLLNCPSLSEFKNSTNPRFTSTPTPVDPLPELKVEYIRDGGNVAENPDFLYTMPEEQDGASFVGFFFPNLIIRDDEEISFPPAPVVSNNFIRKFTASQQFLPVAGPKRGVLSATNLSGVEYPLSKTDRGNLEEKGINPIYQRSDGTIMVYGDDTSYQKFNSILNNLSARDTLISIEIDSENILSEYVFEYNDDAMRTEVKSLLRSYYDTLLNGYGAIDYYDIIFDRNNNQDFVIRENAAVVDTIVSIKGIARKFINRITLRRGASPTVASFGAV